MRELPQPLRRIVSGVALAAVPVLVLGCGDSGSTDYGTSARPADDVTISAAITRGKIDLSPARIGAGPIRLVVANLSPKTEELKIEPAEAGSGRASTGPITPQGTAQVSVDVEVGTYRVSASNGVRPATLAVGRKRPSGQNTLQLP